MSDAPGRRRRSPSFRVLAGTCTAGACPTIYQSDAGKVLVQGYVVSPEHAGIDVPAGESLVEIPINLLLEAARNLC